jgi:hypothetical protein
MGFNGQELVPESVSTCTDTASVGLGTRRTVDGVSYVYAYNGGTTSATVGRWAHLTSDATGYTVDFVGTTKVGIPFGMVRNTTVSAAQYLWLCQRGVTPIHGRTSSTTGIPGIIVFPAASGTFDSQSGLTAIFYNSMVQCTKIRIIVSMETEASAVRGLAYVNF